MRVRLIKTDFGMAAMFPDILWNFLVATHRTWMDIFLVHIAAHFISGRNRTRHAIFLARPAFYA